MAEEIEFVRFLVKEIEDCLNQLSWPKLKDTRKRS